MLLLLLAAATTTVSLHLQVFAVAAAPPNPSVNHHLKTKAKNHLLDYIGSKFESTAIATHNTIIQNAKEEYDHELLPSSSAFPTNVPTSWNTYNPTSSVNGGASLLTIEGPTNEPTADNDIQSGQGNAKEEEDISSPMLLPSSFPTLQVETSSPTPLLLPIRHEDTDSPTYLTILPAEEASHIASFVPSQVPSQHITQSPSASVDDTLTKAVTSVPSSFVADDQDTTTSPTPPEHDPNTSHNAISSVDTPQIICDISLSSSMVENFEQTHVLLVVMTKSIHDIFESHLSKESYDLKGISLHLSTEKSQADSSSPTLRLHASFTGKASFSHFAPTQSELIELLLLHFDVSEFNDRLKFPLRLRTLVEPVVVNSVFFTVEDGTLVNAGYKTAAIASSHDGKEAVLTVPQIQIITLSFIVAALPFVFVASVLLMLRYIDGGEEVYLEADDECADDSVKPEVEEVSPDTAEIGDSGTAAIEPGLKVEIDVPLTPSARVPLSDISESHSEWSSISGSIYNDDDYTRDIESPANIKTGPLGITAAGRHYRRKGTPYAYDGAADNISLVSALWEHHDHLEVYEDYIIDDGTIPTTCRMQSMSTARWGEDAESFT
eukprot:scaffold10744_cov162-Skeletonema_marinoi.AAC.2